MTEQEWLKCNDPEQMQVFLRLKASERKQRLFAVACCAQPLTPYKGEGKRKVPAFAERLQNLVGVAERFADGTATDEDRRAACRRARTAWSLVRDQWMFYATAAAEWSLQVVDTKEVGARPSAPHSPYDWTWVEQAAYQAYCAVRGQRQVQCRLLRDIFGNPFRPVTVDPTWRTATVISLAQAIYEERAFDRLPILADALEDVGCTNTDMLNHCRQPGDHVRGCWLVDLVLGRS